LHWAAYNDDVKVVKYLLERGAYMVYSANKETPIDIAGLCHNYDVTTIFFIFTGCAMYA